LLHQLDDDWLPELPGQGPVQVPGNNVGEAARRERHHQRYRPVRKAVCRRQAGKKQCCNQAAEPTAADVLESGHGCLLNPCSCGIGS
jgi:ribosome biogenesis SPOUT family RNA methylase Rps3